MIKQRRSRVEIFGGGGPGSFFFFLVERAAGRIWPVGRTLDMPALEHGNGRVNFRDVPHCLEQVEEETYATK